MTPSMRRLYLTNRHRLIEVALGIGFVVIVISLFWLADKAAALLQAAGVLE